MSETVYCFRSLIVPDANVALARQLAETLAGSAGAGMWTTPLSPTGTEPATHWISTGLLGSDFAALLPLWEYHQDDDGTWTDYEVSPGQPETIVYLAAEQGLTVSLADVEALLNAADVTEQEWPVACGRLGLQMVQENEVAA